MQSKIAIVGANGFVGRQLVELLIRTKRSAVGIVRSEEGAGVVESLGGTPVRVKDLAAAATPSLIPALEGCAGLIYTASASTGRDAPDRTDPGGLANVVAAAREAGVPRFAYLSGLGIAHYGMNPHCTNSYFLSKMAAEVELFRSPMQALVFRPSYIFGAGDAFLSPLLLRMAGTSEIEIPGDGSYRLQPISVTDAARAILAALDQEPAPGKPPRVFDLVGPEVISYASLLARIASISGRPVTLRERPVHEALAEARTSGYFGLRPHDLACLLCDEVSDPRPIENLVGRALESLDTMIREAIAALARGGVQA
jgi:uncharacterized protein YbjT (DUF2867 family)